MASDISPDFPFESKFVNVHGSRMHYIDEGEGEPVLFLHGNPTSSYLWRNVIPHVSPHRRCIAPDLIGMGRSDKPDIPYRFGDHFGYLEGFIEAVGIDRVTLVLHDWGSGLGFHWARLHSERVRGIAFMEAMLQPMRWDAFPKDYRVAFKLMRTPGVGWLMISVANIFVKQILPMSIVRRLTAAEMRRYAEPFPTIGSRRPLRQWPCEIPIDGEPADVHEAIDAYSRWLQETELPKLVFQSDPGGLITRETVAWCRASLKNLEVCDIGPGIHFLQEDNPHGIGQKLAEWVVRV
jgi:haloalkane dehalogenase